MKQIPLTVILAGLLTACSSSGNNGVSLAIQELDTTHYIAEVIVSRAGESADSSYLREIHRREIQLKFSSSKLCNSGINIARPTASHDQGNRYQLNYAVACSSG